MKKCIVSLIFILFYSCNFFKNTQGENVIASIDNSQLTIENLKKVYLFQNLDEKDSIDFCRNFINRWAIKEILKKKAIEFLPNEDLNEINSLVESYKYDLIVNKYKNLLLTKNYKKDNDDEDKFHKYYDGHKELFKLDRSILTFDYILIPKSMNNKKDLVDLMNKNIDKDILFEIESMCYGITQNYSISDSTWKDIQSLQKRIFIEEKDIKLNKVIEINDGNMIWLLKIKKYIKNGSTAPYSYVKNKIRNIIYNQKKLKFMNNMEIELLEKYTQNGKFKIYN